MFKTGDLVFYGNTGICRVLDITSDVPTQKEESCKYYILAPLYQNCTIYVPVGTKKIYMRSIISRDEANQLIDMIPYVRADAYYSRALNELTKHYNTSLQTHNCLELIRLCKSIYQKREDIEQNNRKLGAIDEKFIKRAEDHLFGELAAALSIEKDQVNEYITTRLGHDRRRKQ